MPMYECEMGKIGECPIHLDLGHYRFYAPVLNGSALIVPSAAQTSVPSPEKGTAVVKRAPRHHLWQHLLRVVEIGRLLRCLAGWQGRGQGQGQGRLPPWAIAVELCPN